jgi:hypothetical protein
MKSFKYFINSGLPFCKYYRTAAIFH